MSLPQILFKEYAVLSAPAKINLRLKVTGRRSDGYHLLSMINVSCSLADSIRIQLTENGENSLAMISDAREVASAVLPQGDENLALRAVREFCREFDYSFGARIEIQKRIPLGAGLGGGSGNAAAVLAFLGMQTGIRQTADGEGRLRQVALSLGADVPFMIDGGLAQVSGIGEVIEPMDVPALDGYPVVLVFPDFGIETARIFEKLRARPASEFISDRGLAERISQGSLDRAVVFSSIENDLLDVALPLHPQLAQMMTLLKVDPSGIASMSGSGSTLFVLPRHPEAAEQLENRVREVLKGQAVAVTLAKLRTVPGIRN